MVKTTLDNLAALVSKGFAAADVQFTALPEDSASVKDDIAAMKSDIADIKTTMITKTDLREEFALIRSEIKSIRDLDDLAEKVENVAGFRKEIDYALERITEIEKHLGIKHPAR